jgi:hypothetical protein
VPCVDGPELARKTLHVAGLVWNCSDQYMDGSGVLKLATERYSDPTSRSFRQYIALIPEVQIQFSAKQFNTVTIGSVWVGAPAVLRGRGCYWAKFRWAGAVVSRDIPANCVEAGNLAQCHQIDCGTRFAQKKRKT